MPSFHIPPQERGEWRGIFRNKFEGDIYSSFNIDLERKYGVLTLGPKSRILLDSGDTSMGLPLQFIRTDADGTERFIGITNTKMVSSASSSPFSAWSGIADTNAPTNPHQMVIHQGFDGDSDGVLEDRLLVSRDTDIAILNRSGGALAWKLNWWTDTAILNQPSLTNGVPHPVASLQGQLALIGDDDALHTIDKNDVVSYNRLAFGSNYLCYNIVTGEDRAWITLANKKDGEQGKMLEWDGFTEKVLHEYGFFGQVALITFIVGGVPYCVNERGMILKLTGSGFEEVARFPFMEEIQKIGFSLTAPTNSGVDLGGLDRNGVIVDGDVVKILIAEPNASYLSHRMRGGIWVFDPSNNNLYHHAALGTHKVAGTERDFGQSVLHSVGGLYQTHAAGSQSIGILAGARVYTSYSGTQKAAIIRLVQNEITSASEGLNRGWFTTPYIKSTEIQNTWSGLWVKFRKFISGSNKIIVKYRTEEPTKFSGSSKRLEVTLDATGVMPSTTTITAIVPSGITVGDEVEILTGPNAGCLFHISTLSGTPNDTASLTVTLDEAAPLADTGGIVVRFDNWVKAGEITDTSRDYYFMPLPASDSDGNVLNNGSFVQYKIELRGYSNEIQEIVPTYKTNVTSEN